MLAAERRDSFIAAHISDILEKYPEQFVAVSESEVVDADPDAIALVEKVKSAGHDPRRLTVFFATRDPRRLMLRC